MDARFDIIVPTYNRYDQLGDFFAHMQPLSNSLVLFWIIDDASETYQPSVIPDWTNIVHIRQSRNQGQAAARNIALERGEAPFIISLDDDAWFEKPLDMLDQVPRLFDQYQDAGCIMFNIKTPDSPYKDWKTGRELGGHITCGCAYRRSAVVGAGGYNGLLHSQAEETDLTLRLLEAGWRIYFSNETRVFHNFVPAERSLQWYLRARLHTTRNDLLIVFMYFPAILVPVFAAGKFLSHLRFAFRNNLAIFRTLLVTFKALYQFMLMIPLARQHRRALSLARFLAWRKLVSTGID